MRFWRLTLLVASMHLILTGCAETYFTPATKDDVNGIRYYLPATYLLVKPDYDHGTAAVFTFQGPDVTQLYAANPYAWIATNTTELTFQNGVLTKAVSKPDSTKVAVDTIGALSTVASKALEAAAANAAKATRDLGAKPNAAPIPVFLFKVHGSELVPLPLETILGDQASSR